MDELTRKSSNRSHIASWWLAFVITTGVLVFPLFLTDIPPLLDYPNHLARIAVLATSQRDPALSHMYRTDWHLVPNMALDVIMVGLMHMFSLEITGKITLASTLLLPLIGVVALNRAFFGRLSYWPLAAAIVAFNRLFFLAFMGFLDGIGLALIGAAYWKALETKSASVRVMVGAVFGLAIFFFHILALLFFGLLILALETSFAFRNRSIRLGRLAASAVPFVLPAALYLHAPIHAAHSDGSHGIIDVLKRYYWGWLSEPQGLKLYGILGPLLTYSRVLDAIVALVLFSTIVALYRTRKLQYSRAAIGLIVALAAFYPLAPFVAFNGIVFIDQRIPIALGFLLFACTLPTLESRRAQSALFVLIGLIVVARTAEISTVWLHRSAQLTEFRTAIHPIQAGDRVLVVQAERNDDPTGMANNPDSVRTMLFNDATLHLPALIVTERKAFWPLMFTSQRHSIDVMPDYAAASFTESTPPWVGDLAHPETHPHGWAPYLDDWQNHFDWVLLLLPNLTPDASERYPDKLQPVVANETAALYRVMKQAAAK